MAARRRPAAPCPRRPNPELVGDDTDELFTSVETRRPRPRVRRRPSAVRSCSSTRPNPGLRPLIQTTTGSVFLSFATFNVAMPPFDDVAVRRAVAFAMDRAAMAETIDPASRMSPSTSRRTRRGVVPRVVVNIPGPDGRGDMGAAGEAMAESRYASGDRCTDPVCLRALLVVMRTPCAGRPRVRDASVISGSMPRSRLRPRTRINVCGIPSSRSRCASGWGGVPTTRARTSTSGVLRL